MSELDQFKQTYITECFELLEEMEEKLLGLPECDYDLGEVNAIFRCAHSIKGGAGAFGFTSLVQFTHEVEALLDGMRSEQLTPTEEILDALLQSVDIITRMVTAAQAGTAIQPGLGEELKGKVRGLATNSLPLKGEGQGGGGIPALQKRTPTPTLPLEGEGEILLSDITFLPRRRLFETGNEPLLIIRELKRAGEVKVAADASKLPALDKLDPEECYLSWKFEVSTTKGMDKVREVFEFVEDECDLTIEEFGAVALPPKKDLSEEDEFGGLFAPMTEFLPLKGEGQGGGDIPAAQRRTPAPTFPLKGEGVDKAPAVTSMRVDIGKVDHLVNMVGELVITQAMLVNHTRSLPTEQFRHLHTGIEELTRHTRELQEAVMSVRMQPVKSVFARMPRIVRDLSRSLSKDIRLEMSGENTEIDKTVIEQLGDPLTHMIRNSIDHGIEKPEDRKKVGKPEQGVIRLSADNSGGRITIEISDDGKGIDRAKVLAKAKEKGLFAPDAQPTDAQIDGIIFMAGFSTAEKVTDVSGRGVGMDVVKRNIEELGGAIEIINAPGVGLKFLVSLPLTLAILDGMIVSVGGEYYIIPINNILESLCPDRRKIEMVAEGHDVLNVRGEFVPILHLSRIFNTRGAKAAERMLVVLVENRREKFGLVVDEIIGQQQVVIKSIEQNSDPVEGVSGATILGDGNVSLILDIAKLQHMVVRTDGKVWAVA